MKYAVRGVLVLIITMCMAVSAFAERFTPPFDEHILGDKIDENMPTPFEVANVKHELIAHTDFEVYNELSDLFTVGEWGLENGELTAVKESADTLMQKTFSYTGEIIGGEYYAFTCRIKETDISSSTKPRNILSAYEGGKWRGESGNRIRKGETDDNGFYELTQVISPPAGTDELRLTAQLDIGAAGTAVFDDFKLYRIILDPLESVLRKPAYKGLIYGDGIADIELDIKITERKNVYTLNNMELLVTLSDEEDKVVLSSSSTELKPLMNITFSSRGLSEGKYYLCARLTDKSTGELISEKEHTIRKAAEDFRPEFYVDEDGHAVRNNEKTFFKRIYDAQSDYAQLAKDIKDTHVDSINHNGLRWWFAEPNNNVSEALSVLTESGKRMNISLIGYWWGNRELNVNMFKDLISQQRDIRAFFKEVTDEYKNNPLIDGYYIFDEPNAALYGEEIRWNNEILADFDLNHPTYGITDSSFSNYGIFTKMTDILGIDPYPVGGKETDDIAQIGRNVREISKNFPNRPVYLCLQGFNYRGGFGDDSRGPNYEELRNMAYQAICEGADGFDCYAYHEMKNDPAGKTFDEWWDELTRLYADVEKYEDIILSSEAAPAFSTVGSGKWLNITSRRYNGKSYLFAVNNTKKEKTVTVKMDGAGEAISDRGESIVYGPNGYELKFSPLEVKILEIAQDDYASPEAELESMGFFNCRKVFPVEKNGEENVLQINEDYIVLNYHAKISDNAKLYINGEEKPLAGKISIKHADEFKVCVVAENGVNKKEIVYKIKK